MDIAQRLINGYPRLSTGNIADAGAGAVKIMDAGIKPLSYTMRVAGPAFTIQTPPEGNLSVHEALTLAPAGAVLVIDAQGNMTSGHMGDLMALACQIRGIAGVIIDGAVRDIEDIIEMGFPLFARGGIPRGNKAQKGVMNKTIQCGGIEVRPSDIIFADSTGVLAFPSDKAEEIYKQAVFIANSELGFVQLLNEGKTLLEIPGFRELHNIDASVLQKDGIDIGSKK